MEIYEYASSQAARLSETEIAHYHREGWMIPQFRLADDEVTRMRDALDALIRANPGVRPEKLISAYIAGDTPLWLVKGVDRSGRSDFVVGHHRRPG